MARAFLRLLFLNAPPPTVIPPLPLHDALPIFFTIAPINSYTAFAQDDSPWKGGTPPAAQPRETPLPENQDIEIEEHTSELQSRFDLVCRLLLEKKKAPPTSTPDCIAYHTRRTF